jgi:protein NrfC
MSEKIDVKKVREHQKTVDRRHFLRITGTIAIGVSVASCAGTNATVQQVIKLADGRTGIPVSGGYLVVDVKKCQGCVTCMLACSLVNEGVENLSLSRIQVTQSSFDSWPDDLTLEQCRQCVDPECVKICPEEALSADPLFGYVRKVDTAKCIGCGQCVDECPYTPSRPMVIQDEKFQGEDKARKCELCAEAPYHWDPAGGGPGGKQACVEVCPVRAIQFTSKVPEQKGDSGYKINLRDDVWGSLGYPDV